MDATDYILSSPANKASLDLSIKQLKAGKTTVTSMEELEKLAVIKKSKK
jgi:PHD/YefM family antitoxin component YafN of YafNO toxin-antitoxin module